MMIRTSVQRRMAPSTMRLSPRARPMRAGVPVRACRCGRPMRVGVPVRVHGCVSPMRAGVPAGV
jgi:hypothetical protein